MIGHGDDDGGGVVGVDQIEPRFGITGECTARPQVVDPRQPSRAVQSRQPQHDRPVRAPVGQHRLRFDDRAGGRPVWGRWRGFRDDASGGIAVHAGGTGEHDAGSAGEGVEHLAQAHHVQCLMAATGGWVGARRPEHGVDLRQGRERRGGGHIDHDRREPRGGQVEGPLR